MGFDPDSTPTEGEVQAPKTGAVPRFQFATYVGQLFGREEVGPLPPEEWNLRNRAPYSAARAAAWLWRGMKTPPRESEGFVVGNLLADGDYFAFVAFPSMTLVHGAPSVELSNVYV
jgi:hypothetical protein